jgi:hypothetical protein
MEGECGLRPSGRDKSIDADDFPLEPRKDVIGWKVTATQFMRNPLD